MTNPLTSWLDAPSAHRGIRFLRDRDWEWWTYRDLAAFARRIAGGIVESGVGHDRILLVERTGPEFVASWYGIMLAGAIPCPAAPPYLFQRGALYERHLRAIDDAVRPSLTITSAEFVRRWYADNRDGTPVRTAAELASGGEGPACPQSDIALLQFTSGSSGRVKGVQVPVAALAANIAAIGAWLEMSEGDATASWLPVHHDMGLIGCLLTPITQQRDLWALDPADFVRDPARYLACFDATGAAMTAMPPFGLDHIVRRVSPESLAGHDFSGWRALIVGAERIDPDVLERFLALLGPFGFDRRALLPAYGLAEATLAVTGLALKEEFTTVRRIVGCGRPLRGVTVAVHDEDGHPLPDGHVGQIVVGGDSVAHGYVSGTASVSLTEWRDGMLCTGDAGFLDDGQLFVIGRLGDAMKVRGRTVFAEDIESALADAGLPRMRFAVLLGSLATGATGVVLIERPEAEWLTAASVALPRVLEHLPCVVLDVPRRSISRTTSGKPRRRDMWAAYVTGRIDGTQIQAAGVGN